MILFFDTIAINKPKRYDAKASELENWSHICFLNWLTTDDDGNYINSKSDYIIPEKWKVPSDDFFLKNDITDAKCKIYGIGIKLALSNIVEQINNCNTLVAYRMDLNSKLLGAEMIRNSMKAINKPEKYCLLENNMDSVKSTIDNFTFFPTIEEIYKKHFKREMQSKRITKNYLMDIANCYFKSKKK